MAIFCCCCPKVPLSPSSSRQASREASAEAAASGALSESGSADASGASAKQARKAGAILHRWHRDINLDGGFSSSRWQGREFAKLQKVDERTVGYAKFSAFQEQRLLQHFQAEQRESPKSNARFLICLLDDFSHNSTLFLVFNRLQESLFDAVTDNRVGPDDVAVISIAVLSGLDALHKEHIVHRDIKPDNIVLSYPLDSTRIKLIDFGAVHIKAESTIDMDDLNTEFAAGKADLASLMEGTLRQSHFMSPQAAFNRFSFMAQQQMANDPANKAPYEARLQRLTTDAPISGEVSYDSDVKSACLVFTFVLCEGRIPHLRQHQGRHIVSLEKRALGQMSSFCSNFAAHEGPLSVLNTALSARVDPTDTSVAEKLLQDIQAITAALEPAAAAAIESK